MSFGESIFDTLLPLEQPVERAIELSFVDRIVQTEHGSQRGSGRFRMESASGGRFGGGFENAGDDHGDNQITLAAGRWGEDGFQSEAPERSRRSGDVAAGGG